MKHYLIYYTEEEYSDIYKSLIYAGSEEEARETIIELAEERDVSIRILGVDEELDISE